MVGTTEYVGPELEIRYAESLVKQRPTIKVQDVITVIHNAGATTSLLVSTETTYVNTSHTHPADYKCKSSFVPLMNTCTLDDGIVTVSTSLKASGRGTITGYTTAVTDLTFAKKWTFVGSTYGGLKRLMFHGQPKFNYNIAISYTDIDGVGTSITRYVYKGTDEIIDVRRLKVRRSADLVVTVYIYQSTVTKAGMNENGSIWGVGNQWLINTFESPEFTCDMYNDVDEQSIQSKPSSISDSGISAARDVVDKYSAFVADDGSVYNIAESDWLELLALAISYSIESGWMTAQSYNSITEIKGLSQKIVGILGSIISGTFTNDVSIPEHIKDQFEELNTKDDVSVLFRNAAIWSVIDEVIVHGCLV